LNQELLDALKEQFNLRLRKSTGQLNQPHLMTENRKNIARIKTVLTQKTGE
jgi:large subunit ribosomal protein L29